MKMPTSKSGIVILALVAVIAALMVVIGIKNAVGGGGHKLVLKVDTWACSSSGDANGLVEVRGSGFTPGGQVRISEMTFQKFRLGVERTADLHGKTIWLFKCDVAGEIAFNAVDKSTSRVAIKVVTIKK